MDDPAQAPKPESLESDLISGAPAPASQSLEPSRQKARITLSIVLGAVLLIAGSGGGYVYAGSMAKPQAIIKPTPSIQVPEGATVISECEPGVGKQYILPKNIPNGPIYNVYQGKVIGLEYMYGKNEIAPTKTPTPVMNDHMNMMAESVAHDIPMLNGSYDHLDIVYMPMGHAGFPIPHYQLDVYLVPDSVVSQITCH